jgi:prepilin-type N-terminal cleavage/methylation domain-containing protein
MKRMTKREDGFSLIELLMAALIFTVVAGGIFSVLLGSQLRYQSDSGLTNIFQEANLAMDQITRDIHSAGYPPPSSFAGFCGSSQTQSAAALAFAWSPNYSGSWPCSTHAAGAPCSVGATCTIPGEDDLILEADQGNGNGVQWIRYSLVGTTLKRVVVTKQANADPVSSTDPSKAPPYLENVINGANPVFTYGPDPSAVNNSNYPAYTPLQIREVNICLMVQSPNADPQTGQHRTITVTGQAVRFNPNQ